MSYAISVQYHHYSGALNVAQSGVIKSDYEGDIIAVASRDQAERLAVMLNARAPGYVLDNNEYAPPEYIVVESTAEAGSMALAMNRLGLDCDYRPDGSRIEVTEQELFGAL